MKKVAKQCRYSTEILTASPAGLQAFIDKLKAIRVKHPGGHRLGRDADGGMAGATVGRVAGIPFKDVPITNVYNSAIAPHIGPLNRSVVASRVDEYKWKMLGGSWWFTPDPIVVTNEGHIINGQHRLLAAEELVESDFKEEEEALAAAKPPKKKTAEDDELEQEVAALMEKRRPGFASRQPKPLSPQQKIAEAEAKLAKIRPCLSYSAHSGPPVNELEVLT